MDSFCSGLTSVIIENNRLNSSNLLFYRHRRGMGGRTGGRVERVRGRQLQGWKSSKSGLGKRDPGHARGRRFWKIIAKKNFT